MPRLVPGRQASKVPGGRHSQMDKMWGFRRNHLLDLYKVYGTAIRSQGFLEDESLLVYLKETSKNYPRLQKYSLQTQLAEVKFLWRNRLSNFDQAVASPLVELAESKRVWRNGNPRVGDHLRDFWDKALGSNVVDNALLELLHDLNEKPAVRMLMARRPTPLWQRKPHWDSENYYPKKAEYYIFMQALELLAEACFGFVHKWEPEYQYRRNVECAESFELTSWLDYIKEELRNRNISHDKLCGGATYQDFILVAVKVRKLRNSALHQGLRTAGFLSTALNDGVELARMLGDERRTRQLESMREELDKGPQFVEYLQSRLATELEKDIEMGIFERILIVMLQRLRDEREAYQSNIIAKRTKIKNEYGIEQREKMLKIRGPIQSESPRAEGVLSFEDWREQRERSAWRNDAVQGNQHEQKPFRLPADSNPFENAPRTSGQPLGLRKSWLSPDADIESKESENAPATAKAEKPTQKPVADGPTTRDPDDEVLPSGPAAETNDKVSVSARQIRRPKHWKWKPQADSEDLDVSVSARQIRDQKYWKWKPQAASEDLDVSVSARQIRGQKYWKWKPQAASEDLDDANIPNDQTSPTPRHAKNNPATPAAADAKKSAPDAPTAATTAAGKNSKDGKHTPPTNDDEVLDFTEVDDNQTNSSSHRLR